jgi:glycosyltransferase involved in cell wall biosynthesis
MATGFTRIVRQPRLLVVCRGSLESVAIVTRFLNQIKILRQVVGVQLYVAWLLDWSYRADPQRKQWVKSIRSEWDFPSVLVYSPPLARLGALGKAISGVWRVAHLAAYIVGQRIQIVLVHAVEGVSGEIIALRRLLGIRCILDMQGAVPEEMAYLGRSATTIRRVTAKERRAVESCEAIFCVSHRMVDHVTRKHSLSRDKIRVVPCCVPASLVGRNIELRQRTRELLGIADKLVLVYSGGTNEYQRVAEMCELFAGISRRCGDAIWLILTWGDHDEFRRVLAKHEVDSRRYMLKNLNQHEVHDHLVAADAGLLLREDHVLNRVSSPTKFGEYLAAGVPVITTPYVGDVSDVVPTKAIGTVTQLPPETNFDQLMSFLSAVRDKRDMFTRRCLDYARRNWTWEAHANAFSQTINAAAHERADHAGVPMRYSRSAGIDSEPKGTSSI